MAVFLAFSYDVEQAVPVGTGVHPYIHEMVGRSQGKLYSELTIAEKQDLWTDYLWNHIWQDPDHFDRCRRSLATMDVLGQLFSGYRGAFTSFVLGKWLDYMVDNFGQEPIRRAFSYHANDVQSHSYTHRTYKSTGDKTREDMAPLVKPEEISEEFRQANASIERHLGVKPIGFRTPQGNISPFEEADTHVLQALKDNGIEYVSCWLCQEGEEPNPVGTLPVSYSHLGFDILEIPGVGPFDCHGVQPSILLAYGKEGNEWTLDERTGIYMKLLEDAIKLDEQGRVGSVFVPLTCHPWAVAYYDPELKFHKNILNFCRDNDITAVSCTDINRIFRNT